MIAGSSNTSVHRAIDTTLKREVAVKIAAFESPGVDYHRQFIAATQIVAGLQHAGIPAIYRSGRLDDGRPFLVMPFITGVSLQKLFAERGNPQVDQVRLLSLFENVCRTMAYVHSRGVIHRDLNTAHLMLDPFGNAQVIGWRSAAIAPELRSTCANNPVGGLTAGTPAYLPPEQARGEPDQASPRADVFMLGGILAEILTGRPPFLGEDHDGLLKQSASGDLSEAFARLENCGADHELIALAKRCLSPKPELRLADAGEVASAIAAFRAGLDERFRREAAERASAAAVEVEKGKRRQVQLALLLVVGLFIVWTGALLWWYDRQAAKWKLLAYHAEEKPAAPAVDPRYTAQRRANQELLQKLSRVQLERDMAVRRQLEERNPPPPPLVVAPPPREAAPRDP